jgi:hypothetical protein
MTDGSTTPSHTGPQPPANAEPRQRRSRARVWLAVGIIAGLLAILAVAGVAVFVMGRFFHRLDQTAEGQVRAQDACIALETRLNRLTPPGATSEPAARAHAIRDENAAMRLFLGDIERLRNDWQVGTDGDRDDWVGWWRELLQARTTYAEALDRQARADEPAFFVAPRTRNGGPVLERLDLIAPQECHGPIRRLAAPDL